MQISNHLITFCFVCIYMTNDNRLSHCTYICEQNGCSALDLARFKHERIVELLESGSKEAKLRAASEGGDIKIVKKLLEEGVDVNTCDLVSNTCINYIFHLFLKYMCNVTIINVNVHSIVTSISTNYYILLDLLGRSN